MNTQETATHTPGNCPAHNPRCPGIAHYRVDPYRQDLYNETRYLWMCDEVRHDLTADI